MSIPAIQNFLIPVVSAETQFSQHDEDLVDDANNDDDDCTTETSDTRNKQGRRLRRRKVGSLYFGFCCDMRRAVIILNSVCYTMLVFYLVDTIQYLLGARSNLEADATSSNLNQANDNDVHNDDYTSNSNSFDQNDNDERLFSNMTLVRIILSSLLPLIVCLLGAIGAWWYNPYMVSVAGIMYTYWSIVDFFGIFRSTGISNQLGHAGSFAINLFVLAYPHYFYILEYQKGIMVPENYEHNVKHSCCCI